MCGNLPPHVDQRTDNLYGQCHQQHPTDNVGHMLTAQHIVAREIADDGDDVRHHTSLTNTQINEAPALKATIEADEQRRKKDGEEIHDEQHDCLVVPFQHA